MFNKIVLIVYMVLCSFLTEGISQGFKAMAILGMNASQIDGDNLYGFKKTGLSVGGRLSYTNVKAVDYSLEKFWNIGRQLAAHHATAPPWSPERRRAEAWPGCSPQCAGAKANLQSRTRRALNCASPQPARASTR